MFDVPRYGVLASLLGFAIGDPHAFIEQAIREARRRQVHSFEMHLGGVRMAVVFEPELARQALSLPRRQARFFRPGDMREWFGRYSPLMLDHDEAEARSARELCIRMMPVLMEDPLVEIVKQALTRDEHGRARGPVFDLGAALRQAAVEWILWGIRSRARHDLREATIRTLAWFEAADTFAAVVPAVRPLTSWRHQAARRSELMDALGLQTEREQDAAATLLLGAVNPSIVALEAFVLARGGLGPRTADDAFGLALARPPVPIIVREALTCLQVGGSTVGPGEGIGVAAGPAGYPLGYGEHACIGGRAAKIFTGALFRAAAQVGLRPAGEVVRGRMHLSWGAIHLPVRFP